MGGGKQMMVGCGQKWTMAQETKRGESSRRIPLEIREDRKETLMEEEG